MKMQTNPRHWLWQSAQHRLTLGCILAAASAPETRHQAHRGPQSRDSCPGREWKELGSCTWMPLASAQSGRWLPSLSPAPTPKGSALLEAIPREFLVHCSLGAPPEQSSAFCFRGPGPPRTRGTWSEGTSAPSLSPVPPRLFPNLRRCCPFHSTNDLETPDEPNPQGSPV